MTVRAGWLTTELQRLIVDGPTNGYSPQSDHQALGTRTLKLSATTSGRFVLTDKTTKRIHEVVPAGSKFWLQPNDILIQRSNSLEFVGTSALFDGPGQTYIFPDLMMRVRVGPALEPAYLWHFLNAPQTRQRLRAKATGTAGNMPKINGTTVRALLVDVPPINEQRRIISKLQTLRTYQREAREALDAVPPLLEKLRQSILAAAFRGDLTKDWREKHPDVEHASKLLERIRAERRSLWEHARLNALSLGGKEPKDSRWKEKYAEPVRLGSKGPWPLPHGWTWCRLDELAWSAGYGTSTKCDYGAAGVAVLRIPNVARGEIDYSDLKHAVVEEIGVPMLLAPADFLIVRTNGSRDLVGRAAAVTQPPTQSTSFASYLIRFRLVDVQLARWVALYWQSGFIRDQIESFAASSAGQYNVSLTELGGCVVPLAPLAEQSRLLEILNTQLTRTRELSLATGALLDQVVTMDRSILAKAFRGELVAQDPNDEPADVMLARLRESNGVESAAPKRGLKKTTKKKKAALDAAE